MFPLRKQHLIENTVLVCLAVVFFWVAWSRLNTNPGAVFSSDPNGYYIYLPAVFIYQDIHHVPEKLFAYKLSNDRGEFYTKYTCGVAYFYLPFFLAAHLYAHLFRYDTMGFSPPYCYAVLICGVCWAFIGLYLLKKLLLRHFSAPVTWITLLAIMLGTNFFNYATLEAGMSHVYNFALFAGIVLAADQYYKAPGRKLAMLIGLLAGWIILTRPTNAALLIFLVLYRVVSVADLKSRIVFFRQHGRHFLWAIPCAFVVMVPQLFYWKEMTGHWIKYSYKGESFIYWNHPRIAEVLFDTQNGLFLYAPALLFMFWAVAMRRKDPRVSFPALGIVFMIITYLFASWHAWWFGGAYGHRCYIDYFPIFAFPMAVTIERIMGTRNRIAKPVFFLVLALFCYYTIGMCQLYVSYAIFDGPRWRWNWSTWAEVVARIF